MDIKGAQKQFDGFTAEYSDFALPKWDDLPDIELYMDQVTVLINKHLGRVKRVETKETVTAAMINNYVKMGFLPAPRKKRYSREHIAQLLIICVMKPSMPIPDTAQIIATQQRFLSVHEIYDAFREMYGRVFSYTLKMNKQMCDEVSGATVEPALLFSVLALSAACNSSTQLFEAKSLVAMLREEETAEKLRIEKAKKEAAAVKRAAAERAKAKKEAEAADKAAALAEDQTSSAQGVPDDGESVHQE